MSRGSGVRGPYRAVVFDLDGVLWDGEPLYHEAFNVVLKPYGKAVTPEDYSRIIGSSAEAAWEWVLAPPRHRPSRSAASSPPTTSAVMQLLDSADRAAPRRPRAARRAQGARHPAGPRLRLLPQLDRRHSEGARTHRRIRHHRRRLRGRACQARARPLPHSGGQPRRRPEPAASPWRTRSPASAPPRPPGCTRPVPRLLHRAAAAGRS